MSLQMVISYILLFMKQGDENGNIYIFVYLFYFILVYVIYSFFYICYFLIQSDWHIEKRKERKTLKNTFSANIAWEVYICVLVLLHANRSWHKFYKSVSEPLKK